MEKYKQRSNCRNCEKPLKTILDLGLVAVSDFIDNESEEIYVPLHMVQCSECELVQLLHTVDNDKMYKQYWYNSSLNPSMVEALHDIVDSIQKRRQFKQGDIVLDIGCNDGTLLSFMPDNCIKVGVDPAENLRNIATTKSDIFINDYYSYIDGFKADVITSIAMFYDLENPNKFIKAIKKQLNENGIWVIQLTDLYSMIKAMAFDNICHEHLEYYSLKVLRQMFNKHGLSIFDIETNDVNGASVRLYVCHKGEYEINKSVKAYLKLESGYIDTEALKAFARNTKDVKVTLVSLIDTLNKQNKKVFIIGASTKGNTLLQYMQFNKNDLPYALEVNPTKFGKKTAGSNIPIISQEEGLGMNPDYLLVLPWHFKPFFIKKLEKYLEQGGHLIFPLPTLEII